LRGTSTAGGVVLRGVIDRITNDILDNKYQLIDGDGQRTRWA